MIPDQIATDQPQPREPSAWRTAVAFFLCAAVCGLLIGVGVWYKQKNMLMTMEQLIMRKGEKIREVMSGLLFKTQALAALVIQGNGEVRDFDRVARAIVDNPAIINILIAPGGVVSNVYPLKGNERVVGFNLLGEGAGNREAVQAMELGELVFGGPFQLVQGGQAMVGRLPVYTENEEEGRREFWGLVSVTLKSPEALDDAELDSLRRDGLAYEIWRVNPDDGQRQVIAASTYHYNANTPYLERELKILNATWRFRILPVRAWYEFWENWALVGLGLMLSGLVARMVHDNGRLKTTRTRLEHMVVTDSLTGTLNRSGLFNAMAEILAEGKRFQIWYLDLDYFKQINDTYGHGVGDQILIRFARNLRKHVGPNPIVSRISGDEFVLICPASAPEYPLLPHMLDAVNLECGESVYTANGKDIALSFSMGSAVYPEDGETADALIAHADTNMYRDKRLRYSSGRVRKATDLYGADDALP